MREIAFRPDAEREIDAIADYTIAEHGKAQAKAYLSEMRQKIEALATFPALAPQAFGLPEHYRKLTVGSHRVIYRFDDNTVTIVRVVHERQDVQGDLE